MWVALTASLQSNGLVDDGLQPLFAKTAAAAIEPDAVDVEDVEEVVEAQANGAGSFVHHGADHEIPLLVACQQLGGADAPFRQRCGIRALLLEKDPGPLLDGREGGDRLQAAVAAAIYAMLAVPCDLQNEYRYGS